ncbi:hypothetical protein [Jeongeupia chitinilytica]|uniref:Uncharacterized protein n=1 Tax=Jeongeupia chitinilytica TaxID=1041641 RepID=A0ABQ3GZ79_9NEIS|nr:hypothetical protein [Jeongeupia chitinilytica]GHD60791.1 hypothetical protein GCM10007350_14370 [Jeongeupia chitinilytica]
MSAPAYRPVYFVQDTDTGKFLCPHEGDVGFTKLIINAGPFPEYQDAFDTAVSVLGGEFVIFSCALPNVH